MEASMRQSALWALLVAPLILNLPAQCWWEDGHRTAARLAAYYLTPSARAHLAQIMGVPDDAQSVADGLALASTWPDEIKKDRPETASWHYIDIALQDRKDQISERCPEQNCVTARIDLFSAQLINDKSAADPAVDLDALRFLVHFVGDLHQPLHATSDADLGGNCEPLDPVYEKARNVHALWDGPLVSDVNPDDRLLAGELKKELDALGEGRRRKMAEGTVNDWAWESHRVAEKEVYKRLHIPAEPAVFPESCKVAPEAILDDRITVEPDYLDAMKPIIRLQLERAGLRLARLLNTL
jgi:hypothetical protein